MKELKRVTAILVFVLILGIVVSILTAAIPTEYEAIDIAQTVEETVETQEETEPIIIETEPEITIAPTATKFAKCQINLRATPSMAEEPVETLPRGTGVAIFPSNDGWYEIEYLGNRYYVWNEYLVDAETWAVLSEVPFSDQVPLSEDLQKYLWEECQDIGMKYCFALALIDQETGGTFNPKLVSKTHDWGLTQINRCNHKMYINKGWITCSEDLLNPYNSIHCGLDFMNQYVKMYGCVERSYAQYNTGKPIQSNKNSRSFMKRYQKWIDLLGDI